MGELGELLELLHTGGARGRTVRAVVRTWRHRDRANEAFLAAAEEQGATVYAAVGAGEDTPPAEEESVVRLWLRPPDRAREEVDRDGETSVTVRAGRRWWRYDPDEGAVSNAGDEDVDTDVGGEHAVLFDPGWLLGPLVLEPAGEASVGGRRARLARARPRTAVDAERNHDWELFTLGAGADEWELAVDAEHGVLLRAEARRGGEPFQRMEVAEVAVGEELPDEVFTFEPPPGEELRALDERGRLEHHVGLDDVVQRAPFTVFVPDRLEPGWERRIAFDAGSGRPEEPPVVFVHLGSTDGHWQLWIEQLAAAVARDRPRDSLDVPGAWETVRRGERTIEVREPSESWAPTLVRTELEGTAITISSEDMRTEQLVDLAARLVPAPAAPPPL